MLRIRKADVDDISVIRDLTLRIWPETYRSILSGEQIDYMLERSYHPDFLAEQMQTSQFIIISNEKEEIGFASFGLQKDSGLFHLHKIYLLPSYQGKGAGKAMIEYICEDVRKRGGRSIQLNVNRENKARQFYERLGFVIVETVDIDIGSGYFMNDFIMQKNLV